MRDVSHTELVRAIWWGTVPGAKWATIHSSSCNMKDKLLIELICALEKMNFQNFNEWKKAKLLPFFVRFLVLLLWAWHILQVVTVIITIISNNIPDANPAYKGRSSSVICHDPKLSVMGGSGVDDLNERFTIEIVLLFLYKTI